MNMQTFYDKYRVAGFSIEKEYVHSSGLVEFFFIGMTTLGLVVAFLKAFKLKGPIHLVPSVHGRDK